MTVRSPVAPAVAPAPRRIGSLRRQLGQLATLSVSLGVLAPTLAMSATGVEPARLIGRAAPLAFLYAALGIGVVAYGFVRLSGEFSHAGSVYAFAGNTLGPRAGFLAGWALMGTYLVFPAVSMLAVGEFGQAFLKTAGIDSSAPWLPISLGAWAVIFLLASRDMRVTARSLLALELVSLALIVVLTVVIYVKLGSGSAPRGQDLSTDWLKLPSGTTFSTVALAATAGFLSFAGFEATGTLGEESNRPRRTIPRAMVATIVLAGVIYLACMVAQTLGFGTDARGVKAFSGSAAPLADLGQSYVGEGMADALNLGAVISAVGAGLGCAAVSARIIFALSRDAAPATGLAETARRTSAPLPALSAVMALDLAGLLAFGIAGTPALKAFFYLATIGVLSLLVMYMVTNAGAVRLLLGRERRAEALLPVAGIVVAGYVLYRNVWPVPDFPFNVFPYVVAAWLVLGLGLVAVAPGLADRVERGLAARRGQV
jgi:amino acid transporter